MVNYALLSIVPFGGGQRWWILIWRRRWRRILWVAGRRLLREAVDRLVAAGLSEAGEAMKVKHLFRELDHDQITAADCGGGEAHDRGNPCVCEPSQRCTTLVTPPRISSSSSASTKPSTATRSWFSLRRNRRILRSSEIEAVHMKCGEGFWEEIVGAMRDYFRQGRFTEGVIHGISTAGRVLAEHFPAGTHAPE